MSKVLERYEKFCDDLIECSYDDEGNVIGENVKNVIDSMGTYARVVEAESKIQVAEINAEAELKAAKIKATESSIGGGIGAVVDIAKLIANTINMKSVIWAEESANKIVSSKYLGFIKKQP